MSHGAVRSYNNTGYRECSSCERTAGWISVLSNLILAIFKVFVGFISGSKAILGDSLYSFKDFVTSLVVVVGIKVSGKPADEKHPYGYGKIEFVAMLLISMCLCVAAVFLFIHSVKDVWLSFYGHTPPPKLIAFWAAIISMIANYKLSSYVHCVGERLKSPAMIANAKHNHSDAISSAFVAGAILGANVGLFFLDPLVAVIETLDVLRLSSGMLNDSIKGIMDASMSREITGRIESIARLVPGVRKVSSVVARQTGQSMWIDITIRVDHHKTHDEGYRIGLQVRESLEKAFNNVAGVILSIEPYVP